MIAQIGFCALPSWALGGVAPITGSGSPVVPTERLRLLFVDDERLIRAAYARQLRDGFEVLTAQNGAEALAMVAGGPPFAVVFSDLAMPGFDGLSVLARVRELMPSTLRVLFSGKVELREMVRAVNEIGLFRLLLKPCPKEKLWECLNAAAAHHASTSARSQGESDVVALAHGVVTRLNPALHARLTRLQRYIRHMSVSLDLPDAPFYEIVAAVSCLGLVTLDRQALTRFSLDRPTDAQERQSFATLWQAGVDLLQEVPGLRLSGEIVGASTGPVDKALASRGEGPSAMLGAQLLKAAVQIDAAVMRGSTRDEALEALRRQGDVPLRLLDAMTDLAVMAPTSTVQERAVANLEVGMVLEEHVRSTTGLKLAPAGQPITAALLQLIEGYARTVGVVQPLLVRVRAA